MNAEFLRATQAFATALAMMLEEASLQTASQVENTKSDTPSDTSSDVLLTTEQVCKILSVTSVTLWRWQKRGYLKSIRIGGLNRYYKSDIDRIMNSAR